MLFRLVLIACCLGASCGPSWADECPRYLGKLYARGLRQFWTGADKDFGKTVFDPLVDAGFDHSAIAALEDTIIDNYKNHPPSGSATALAQALRVSEPNAQVILSFYDLAGTQGVQTPVGYSAFTQAKQHMRNRFWAPVAMYFKENQTRKDITAMTEDLRQQLGKPGLSENDVYQWMWALNLEMGKAWDAEVPLELRTQLEQRLNRRALPTSLSELALHLYRTENWSKQEVADALGISPLSFSHHLHATGVEPNNTPWAPREDALLRQLYGVVPVRELAQVLGRTEASVSAHAGQLGLTQETLTQKPDLFFASNGSISEKEAAGAIPLKINGVLQAEALGKYLAQEYLAGKTLQDVAQSLNVAPSTLHGWNAKLQLYPRSDQTQASIGFDLGAYLATKQKPGHAIFEAFLALGNTLPSQKRGKGDPGRKLMNALRAKKPAQALINEIPVELRQQHPETVEAFRKAYEERLAKPLLDRSKKQGHAVFEAFLAQDNTLPREKRAKGDPGQKLSSALRAKKPAQALINEIPEELRQQQPEAVEAFRKAYEERLAKHDVSKKRGHAVFEAFLAQDNTLPPDKRTKGDPGRKLLSALREKKPAQALINEIPVELRQQHPEAVEAFRKAYEERLAKPAYDVSKKQGHAVFEAFLAQDNTLPGEKKTKGDPGQKLSSALRAKKPAQALINEIPEELRQQQPEAVEAFRKAYEERLAKPLLDRSKKQGHAVFEAFLAENSTPSRKGGKGDPGRKLSAALASKKPTQTIINEIPEELRQQHPEAVEAFRKAYEELLEGRTKDPPKE